MTSVPSYTAPDWYEVNFLPCVRLGFPAVLFWAKGFLTEVSTAHTPRCQTSYSSYENCILKRTKFQSQFDTSDSFSAYFCIVWVFKVNIISGYLSFISSYVRWEIVEGKVSTMFLECSGYVPCQDMLISGYSKTLRKS